MSLSMTPLLAGRLSASVAKRHGRMLTPAVRAYKADPKQHQQQHQEKQQHQDKDAGGKKKEHAAPEHGAQLEKKAAAPSAGALQQHRGSGMMMMSPLLGNTALEAFFPPSAVSMLRQMDSMLASDPFFSRTSAMFDNDPFFASALGAPSRRSAAVAAPSASGAWRNPALMQPQLLPLDISEMDGAYLIKADLPGVDKSDVKVEVSPDGDFLTIRGERSEERREGGGSEAASEEGSAEGAAVRPLRVERRWSSWSRSLALSPDVDVEGVKASLKDGVLQVTLPKLPVKEEEEAAPAPKTIAVE
jgi:HSP20 family protein